MEGGINPLSIFLPMLAVVALTVVAFARLAAARGRAVKEEARDPAYYRAFLGNPEPEYAVVAARHYANLFELPVLFYAGCVTAFVVGAVTPWSLGWAWAYVVARLVQSAIHLSYNNPAHRGGAFVVGWLFVAALWISIGIGIVSRL